MLSAKNLKLLGVLLFVVCIFLSRGLLIKIVDNLKNIDLIYWMLGVLTIGICPVLAGLRTKILLSVEKKKLSTLQLIFDALMSSSLNTFSLSGVGEAYRVKKLKDYRIPLALAGAAIFIDKLSGLLSFGLTVIVVWLLGYYPEMNFEVNPWIYVLAFVGLSFVIFLIRHRIVAIFHRKLSVLEPALKLKLIRPSAIAVVTLLAFANCFFSVLSVYFLGLSLGYELEFFVYLVNVPLIMMAFFVPITVGGIGVRELGYVYLLKQYGMASEEGVALGLTQYSSYVGLATMAIVALFISKIFKGLRPSK